MIGFLVRLLPYALSFFSSLCIMVLELVASRLVAQHVGASLIVWTSVIGIILAGICLGNVLGGRLADRIDPRRALGPLYALGAALTVGCLWMNAYVARIPGMSALPWDLRTVLVVSLDFLVPATVLGMISPVVAKIAVMQARRAGGAIGDIYFLGAVGSIVGTFLAGFWLIYIAPTSTIVAIVAAAIALLAAGLANSWPVAGLALGSCGFLVLGALESIGGWLPAPGLTLGNLKVNAWGLVGHALIVAAAVVSWARLPGLRRATAEAATEEVGEKKVSGTGETPKLGDLATLAFVASLAFMALEMVAGRLVTRHLGSSVYSWTSVIGVLLGGLSLGNYLGGKWADRVKDEKGASHLFLLASIAVALILLAETPPTWLVRNPIGYFFRDEPPQPLAGEEGEFLRLAMSGNMAGYAWWFRVLFWTGIVFFIPALTMGTVSPVVAKLAVDRARAAGRTGSAIGQVYAWGMVGSLFGTFLTGFLLIDVLGTKGVLLVLATSLAVAATALGSVWHAAWAGVPLGLCVIAFLPPLMPEGKLKEFFVTQGRSWGLRERAAHPNDPDADIAYIDESNYYFIKVNNERAEQGIERTLVLDNLIHGYFVLGSPRVLDYDYEHIYAYVTDRALRAKAKAAGKTAPHEVELGTLFLGGGSYTFPRYLQAVYPKTWAEVAEIDPAVTRANHEALGLPRPDSTFPEPRRDAQGQEVVTIRGETVPLGPAGSAESREAYFQAIDRIAPGYHKDEKTGEGVAVIEGETVRFGPYDAESSRAAYLQAVQDWYENSRYRIRTTWGDARQYVLRHQDQDLDIIYGDAFNDFSVPWHLTTREFNDKLANMLTPEGVYMINIIDVYESDVEAATGGPTRAMSARVADALRGRWSGNRPAKEVASSLVFAMLTPEFAEELDDAARKASEALLEDQRVMTREELLALVGKAIPAEAGGESDELPDERKLAEAAAQRLAEERGSELLVAMQEARSGVYRRYENQKNESYAPVTLIKALDAVRTAAEAEEGAADRAEALDDTLNRCLLAARAVAKADPGSLDRVIDQLRGEAIESYDENAERDVRTRIFAVLQLLEAIRNAAQATAAEVRESAPEIADDTLANRRTTRMVAQVADDLAGVRSQLARKARAIREAAKGDGAAATAAARALIAYARSRPAWVASIADSVLRARGMGAFLGAWVNTARLTFPHVYIFGTASERGSGNRETFVVVASRAPLDLKDLGRREGEPKFSIDGRPNEPDPYGPQDMKAIEIRSRGIILTDDYAPVENLLAPVAETRGD